MSTISTHGYVPPDDTNNKNSVSVSPLPSQPSLCHSHNLFVSHRIIEPGFNIPEEEVYTGVLSTELHSGLVGPTAHTCDTHSSSYLKLIMLCTVR